MLPSSEVYEVLQDSRGYLWFGTDNGVSRFDGYEFETFGPDEGLKNNVVFYLFEDDYDRIWMATMSENLYYYDYERDSIFSFPYNHLIQEEVVAQFGPPGFYVDKEGTVYRNLAERGIVRIDESGNKAVFPAEGEAQGGNLILEVDNHHIVTHRSWDRPTPNELPFFFQEGDTLREERVFNDTPMTERIFFYTLRDSSLLVNAQHYLYLFKGKKLRWYRPTRGFNLSSAYQTSDGVIFLGGSFQQGVRKFNDVEALRENNYISFLPGNTVSHILQDNSGGLWFTTTQNGVFHTTDPDFIVYDASSGLAASDITEITFKDRDHLWFSTFSGDVYELDRRRRVLRHLPRPSELREVYDIRYDAGHNVVWVASSGGLYVIEPGGDLRLWSLKDESSQKNWTYFKEVIPLSSQRLLTRRSSGFQIIDVESREYVFNSLDEGVAERITDIFESADGRIWIGKLDGFYEFSANKLVRPSNLPPALHYRVEAIREMADGTLVVGTKGGGVVFWNGESFRVIGDEEGLSSDMVECVFVDSSQQVWVGTLNGLNKLSRIGPDSIAVEILSVADGLPSNEVNEIGGMANQVWVGTNSGLVRIPEERSLRLTSPPPKITSVSVNNKEVTPSSIGALAPRENNLQVNFLTLNFALGNEIDYQYRLRETDPWTTTRDRSLTFPALSPGTYRFEVKSKNEDGVWSESVALPFKIFQPAWEIWWFWALVFVVISVPAYSLYQERLTLVEQEALYQSERAKRVREKASLERQMQELKRSALQAQINPHFIFNSLNSIQGFIADGAKKTAMSYLSRFARLMRAALNASLQSTITLEEEMKMLENYLELERMRFHPPFTFKITLEPGIDPLAVQVPPMLLQPYVENAILHGFSKGHSSGHIDIQYRMEGRSLAVTVTDNGQGIKRARKESEKKQQWKKSVGMNISKQRLEMTQTQGNRHPVVKVEDLSDLDAAATGTRVTIWIDLK